MFLKISGSVCIVLGGGFIGNYMSQRQNKRKKQLLSLKKAFIFLKSRIEYSCEELSEAFENVAFKTEKPINILFENSVKNLKNREKTLEEIWTEECDNFLKKSFLSKEDIEMLKMFGKTLGYSDMKHQVENINLQVDYINKIVETINQEGEKEEKIYRSLGILGSLLLVIILL